MTSLITGRNPFQTSLWQSFKLLYYPWWQQMTNNKNPNFLRISRPLPWKMNNQTNFFPDGNFRGVQLKTPADVRLNAENWTCRTRYWSESLECAYVSFCCGLSASVNITLSLLQRKQLSIITSTYVSWKFNNTRNEPTYFHCPPSEILSSLLLRWPVRIWVNKNHKLGKQ